MTKFSLKKNRQWGEQISHTKELQIVGYRLQPLKEIGRKCYPSDGPHAVTATTWKRKETETSQWSNWTNTISAR